MLHKPTQTKQDLADIVKIIEELIRQRFELPAFSELIATAQRVRNQVKRKLLPHLIRTVCDLEVIIQFDSMFLPHPVHQISGWQQLKREPKKPTNTEIKVLSRNTLNGLSWAGSFQLSLTFQRSNITSMWMKREH